MFSAVVLAHSIRWAVPTAVMVGSAPLFFGLWGTLRLLTCVLPKKFYRTGDDILYTLYQRMVVFCFYHVPGIQILAYGDTDLLKKKENAIYICNHQCTVDWLVTNFLAIEQGSLGHVRYILKDGLKFLPFYGAYFRQHGCIYVKRGGKFNQAKLEKDVAYIKENNEPIWLVIFPEGTRYNPELPQVLERSKKYARDEGLKELEQVLSPRTKALHTCVNQLAGHVDAVYDITIGYSNTTDSNGQRTVAPPMTDFLLGKSPQLHLYLERIALHNVPKDERKLHLWLHKQYEKKDKILKDFYSNDSKVTNAGRFPGVAKLIVYKHRQTLPCMLFFVSCLGLIFVTSEGRSLYGKYSVIGAIGGCLWMAFRS